MMTVRPYLVELETRPLIALPFPLPRLSAKADSKELDQLHQDTVFGFVAPERLGFVRDRDAVVGFESHSFAISHPNLDDHTTWQVSRLELVSLLRHDEARVYADKVLPRMDELSDVPHRPLNEFEEQSMPKLRHDEDLVVEANLERITMLGAVRAGNDCLQCHEGARGSLLGAFSYELTPIVATMKDL